MITAMEDDHKALWWRVFKRFLNSVMRDDRADGTKVTRIVVGLDQKYGGDFTKNCPRAEILTTGAKRL